jgi:hypothetical protein
MADATRHLHDVVRSRWTTGGQSGRAMDLTLPIGLLGFGIVAAAGAWLGAGRFDVFCGLVGTTRPTPWPVGVQEGDTPHFAVEHLAAAMGLPIDEAVPATADESSTIEEVSGAAIDDLARPSPVHAERVHRAT